MPTTTSVIRVILKDGQSLKVRPIIPDDKEKLRELFYRLSPQTRYLRFGYMKTYISEQELEYFTSVTPPDMHAYLALMGEGEYERIIAVGRWFLAPDGKTAEISFIVEDAIQVRGIGTALLEKLADAAVKYRIKRFIARVLQENTRMIDVFENSGFSITKSVDDGVYEFIFDLEEREEYARRHEFREQIARSAGVRRILYPRSIAVIGASRDPERPGGKVFRNLLFGGFTGRVFPVNSSADAVGGVLGYHGIEDVPGYVDLAIIAVPAVKVLDIVEQCARKKIAGAVILSAGFGESGPEGRERQILLREKALSYGMRIIGPNCLGIMNTDPGTRMNASMAGEMPPRGNISISSHSGALGLALLDYVRSNNLGIAHFASIGNRIDISSNDLLSFWEEDENTSVILLYLESFGNPRRFSRIARRITRRKPIIAMKAGRSEVGIRAASSHTGALAGSDVAVDALFRQAGVIRVNTIAEMFNVAKTLSRQPLPQGPRIAIITNAGGPGVLAADAAINYGLSVPVLSGETGRQLASFLPKEASLSNPVDMIASATGEQFGRAVSAVLDDPGIDAVIVINIPVRPYQEIASGLGKALEEYKGEKTVIACFMMSAANSIEIRAGQDRTVPVYMFPEDAVQAFSHAYTYSRYRIQKEGRVPLFHEIAEEKARKHLEDSGILSRGGWLSAEASMDLLREYGIPAVETRTALSPEEAALVAKEVGFPVVMKLFSKKIIHKTDVGGVILGLQDEEEVKRAYEKMKSGLESRGKTGQMEGVLIQPFVKGGQEVILGMTLDPVFGPLLMFGIGGIHVELIKDVAFSIHPLTDKDPDYMFSQLKGMPLLQGWRGGPVRDVDSLREVLLRFSALIEDLPEIMEMEINPLFVFDRAKGCTAVDARILFRPEEPE